MGQGFFQIAVFFAIIVAVAPFVGAYMARVFSDERVFLTPVVGPVERGLYRLFRVGAGGSDLQQDWKAYAKSLVIVSVLFSILLYAILRTQGVHPFNPEGFNSGTWDVSFNTASSFVTNTQLAVLRRRDDAVRTSARWPGWPCRTSSPLPLASAVLVALIRGIVSRQGNGSLGNFFKDLTRIILYILLPFAVVGDRSCWSPRACCRRSAARSATSLAARSPPRRRSR